MINLETRGKKSDGNWVHGIYLWYLKTPQILYKNVDSAKIGTLVEVTKDTISMNTGYIDADRRPIFEGDILGLNLNNEEKCRAFGIVRWNEGGYFYIDDSFLLFSNTKNHTPIGEMIKYITENKHTLHIMGNRWDNPDLIPEVFRTVPKKEPIKESEEKPLSEGVEVNKYGQVFVPVGGIFPYTSPSGSVEFYLECVETKELSCSECALKERNCSNIQCTISCRKDHKNVKFKIKIK